MPRLIMMSNDVCLARNWNFKNLPILQGDRHIWKVLNINIFLFKQRQHIPSLVKKNSLLSYNLKFLTWILISEERCFLTKHLTWEYLTWIVNHISSSFEKKVCFDMQAQDLTLKYNPRNCYWKKNIIFIFNSRKKKPIKVTLPPRRGNYLLRKT